MKKGAKVAILTLGLSAIVNLIITIVAWSNSDWDKDAPVKMGYFVAINLIWAVAILYVLLKVLFIGAPGILK